MTVQTTSNLSDSLKAEYLEDYIKAAQLVRTYDNLSTPVGADMSRLGKGTSVIIPFIGDLEPGTTTISETADVTPSTVGDTTASITPTSRWGAIQCSEKLLNMAYTDYGAERFAMIGKNQMETVDLLAQDVATTGAIRRSYAATARSSLDAATNYYLTSSVFGSVAADLQTLKVPTFMDGGRSMWTAIIHPYALTDFLASADILAVGEYQKANIILGHELGEYGQFKIVCTPWAKVFWAAGAANASPIATTIAASATANLQLAKTIEVAANTNMGAGDRVLVGTIETGNARYPTNEFVTVVSVSSTTITIAGEGANGGLRFDHAVGETVSNADNVGCAVFGGPKSLMKVWDSNMDSEYGTIVGPKTQGLLDQFQSLGWKFYGNYGLPIETRIVRYEHTFSRDA
jgi:N4-gp56 family major capsid protein